MFSLFAFIEFNPVVQAPPGYPWGEHRIRIQYYQTKLAYDHDGTGAGAGEWFFEMRSWTPDDGYTPWQSTGKISVDKDRNGWKTVNHVNLEEEYFDFWEIHINFWAGEEDGWPVSYWDPESLAYHMEPIAVSWGYYTKYSPNTWHYDDYQDGNVWFYWAYYIYNYGPTANPIADQTTIVGVPVNFYGSGSDPEGDNLYYEWDFGDGETSTAQNPTHTYTDAGTYTIKFRVKDYFNSYSSWRTATVTVSSPVHLLVRGWDDRIYYNVWTRNDIEDWGGWTALPEGTTPDTPAAAVLENRLHIVVRGMDDSLWHGQVDLTTNSFLSWTWLSGTTPSAPELTVGYGGLILVVRGMDNRIYYRLWNDASWGDWVVLPGATCDSPAAVAAGSPSLDYMTIAVRGLDGESLWYGFMDLNHDVDTGFSGWNQLPGGTPSKPVLTAWKKKTVDAVLYLVVKGFDDGLYYKYAPVLQLGTFEWSSWGLLGRTRKSPGVTVVDDRLHLVVEGTNGIFYHGFHIITVGWSGWTEMPGSTPSSLELAERARTSTTTPP